MKIKIDKNGDLALERHGQFKLQCCPYQEGVYCGDWCPLFQEPKYSGTRKPEYSNITVEGTYYLKICRADIYTDKPDFIDERNQNEN